MQRRRFIQKISLYSVPLLAIPSMSFGKLAFPDSPKLKFITASDGHWGQTDTDYEGSHRQLIEAVNRERDVDFVVLNGDLIHDTPSLLPRVREVYNQFKVPFYVTRGNHDRVDEETFKNVMGQPTNYSFMVKDNFGIVLLDCSNAEGKYLCVNLQKARSFLEQFANLSQVFIFVHISQNDWTRYGVDCQDFLNLVASFPNVKATFHGHDHDVDGMMIYKKKPFFWSGHFGGSWGNPFPCYRVCEAGADGKAITYLKTIQDGTILNKHNF
jgi:Calcineurin-like phosphoesterase